MTSYVEMPQGEQEHEAQHHLRDRPPPAFDHYTPESGVILCRHCQRQ